MKIKITLVIFFLIISNVMIAQETIDLKKAITIAMEKNTTLSTIQNNLSVQKLRIKSTKGSLYPTLSLSGSWSRNNSVSEGGTQLFNNIPIYVPGQNSWQNSFNLGLNSQVLLFNGFANYENIELEKQNDASLRLGYEKTKDDIIISIQQKFFDVLKKEKIVFSNQANLQVSKDLLDKIRVYVEVGKKTISDVYKQDVQVAQDELTLESSINDFKRAKIDLLFTMNDDLNKEYSADAKGLNAEVTLDELKNILNKSKDVNSLISSAYNKRNDYKSALQDIKINQIKLGIAQKNLYFPTISAFGNYNLNGKEIQNIADTRSLSIGLSLSYYFFQGYTYDVNKQIAEVNIKQKSEDLVKLEQQIKSDLKKSIIDLETAYKQIEILDRNIKSAEQDKLLSEENFRIGYGTLLDVQTATTRLNNLITSRINSIYNFYIARKQIEYLSGQLTY